MNNNRFRGRISYPHIEFYRRVFPELKALNPQLFNKSFPLPLAIGIHKELAERTRFSPKEISILLAVWTRRSEYLFMMSNSEHRYDLELNQTELAIEHYNDAIVKVINESGTKRYRRWAKRFAKLNEVATTVTPVIGDDFASDEDFALAA